MKILIIPDVHLKPWMFERADEALKKHKADKAVCLMDIPDDWGKECNLGLYEETFDKALWFQVNHPDTLWCYGNHDLSYMWGQPESGFSPMAIPVVNEKLSSLRRNLPDERQMAYMHRINDVLFLHGGLTDPFVRYYAADKYDDVDAVIEMVNMMGMHEIWDEASPIWYRPQFYNERMYKADELLQVVGHTPVHSPNRKDNVISCDTFSTYRNGEPIGTEEFLLIDTETWEYECV